MKFVLLSLLSFLFIITANIAQTRADCKTRLLNPRHFLNLQYFLGEWYVQKSAVGLPENVHNPEYKCLSITFTPKNGANHLNAKENYLELVNGTTQTVTVDNDVQIEDALNPAVWTINANLTGSGLPLEIESVILHTDHNSWAVQYTCSIRNGSTYEGLGLWTRDRNVNQELYSWLEELAIGIGFPRSQHIPIDQTGCSN